MSKFNDLLHGDAERVCSALEFADATNGELRAALQNAHRRIAELEKVAHPPAVGMIRYEDAMREFDKLERRIEALGRLFGAV